MLVSFFCKKRQDCQKVTDFSGNKSTMKSKVKKVKNQIANRQENQTG